MKASVISIGNELLTGRSADTNSAYINSRLFSLGVETVGVYTVGDDKSRIVEILRTAGKNSDIILTTGGLGPTDDDITREAVSEFLSRQLELEHRLVKALEEFFRKRGKRLPEKNKVQAYLPEGSLPMENSLGTAAGIKAEFEGKLLLAFPGVPDEMKEMFEGFAIPEVEKLLEFSQERSYVSVKRLKCCGSGESNVAEMLGSMMKRGRNPQVNCTVSYGIITIEIKGTADSPEQAEQMVEEDSLLVKQKLGELVFSDDDKDLAEVVGARLSEKSRTLALAESCTGGWISKLITDVPGSSKYFVQSWVTYSNESKSRCLGVPEQLIREHGAVSGEVAEAMGKAARKRACSDFAIAITGIAGPGGGSEQKPVGSVYINVTGNNFADTRYFIFPGSREMVRKRAANAALNALRLRLLD